MRLQVRFIRFKLRLRLNALQTIFLQSRQRGTSRHHAHLMPRSRQVNADPTANGACAVNTNFHKR